MYPKRIKKYQTPAGPIGTDNYGIKGNPSQMSTASDKPATGKGTGGATIMQGAGTLGTIGLSLYKAKNPAQQGEFGITNIDPNTEMAEKGLAGMNMGMQLGSAAGPIGSLIGGGVGLVGGAVYGFHKAQKDMVKNRSLVEGYRKENRKTINEGYTQNTKLVDEQAKQQRSLIPSNYKMYSAKHGGVFPKLQQGGVTPHAVIPSGPLHSEKNNLGTKGLPVVHSETNEKKAEVEREEIIFTKPQSEVLEKFHKELTANPSDEGYIKFGEIVGKFINGAKDMNDE